MPPIARLPSRRTSPVDVLGVSPRPLPSHLRDFELGGLCGRVDRVHFDAQELERVRRFLEMKNRAARFVARADGHEELVVIELFGSWTAAQLHACVDDAHVCGVMSFVRGDLVQRDAKAGTDDGMRRDDVDVLTGREMNRFVQAVEMLRVEHAHGRRIAVRDLRDGSRPCRFSGYGGTRAPIEARTDQADRERGRKENRLRELCNL